MASSRPAPEAPYNELHEPREFGEPGESGEYAAYGPSAGDSWDEWNPTEDSIRPVRGRHRVGKQRGGMGRSGAVLGVGMVAAIGAGGMATAQDKPKAPVSMPDVLPDMADLPGVGDLVSGGSDGNAADTTVAAAPLTQAGLSGADTAAGQTDAGEALRARILQQADQQQAAADQQALEAAASEAAAKAAEAAAAEAAKVAEAERKAEAERRRKAEEERKRKAEEERLRKLAASFTLPLSSYQGLGPGYGSSGSMWSANHTGQDFTASSGTPVKAVHTGTIKEAGWAGSYGYRIVLELDDGTEIWYAHLSSMIKTSGKVTTGDTIGRVGSTGNSSGPHLHLEVRPGGGDPVDPLAWLRGKGLNV
ncbi:M23 family metallopeptidase [Streptomyces gobiensis]|uniref:M23 family metallopeptidase n=1 Tax=Streptomyces gobiensis TaxID=2875706 RepID=UPI001E50BB89|nr:M23 family metallopeptidase [Streptomyces gobiensis]UGY92778.1 M23 family metallopeptidase [Streptomyces gobiensis]